MVFVQLSRSNGTKYFKTPTLGDPSEDKKNGR